MFGQRGPPELCSCGIVGGPASTGLLSFPMDTSPVPVLRWGTWAALRHRARGPPDAGPPVCPQPLPLRPFGTSRLPDTPASRMHLTGRRIVPRSNSATGRHRLRG